MAAAKMIGHGERESQTDASPNMKAGKY